MSSILRHLWNRRTLFWLLLLLVAIAVLVSLSLPSVTAGPDNSPAARTLSTVRQLSLALQQYARDHADTHGSGSKYPRILRQLVSEGYFQEADFDKITKDIRISYFPPDNDNPSGNHLLILALIPKYVVYATAAGTVDLQKAP